MCAYQHLVRYICVICDGVQDTLFIPVLYICICVCPPVSASLCRLSICSMCNRECECLMYIIQRTCNIMVMSFHVWDTEPRVAWIKMTSPCTSMCVHVRVNVKRCVVLCPVFWLKIEERTFEAIIVYLYFYCILPTSTLLCILERNIALFFST